MERRSQALFVAGIVSLAMVPVAAGVFAFSSFRKGSCEMDADFEARTAGMVPGRPPATDPADCERFNGTIYGGAVAAVALLGGGVAMLVVGVQKVPVRQSTDVAIRPWFSPTAAGLGLQTSF